MNPYKGADFFSFFAILAKRLFTASHLAPDEIQLLVFLGVALSASLVGSLLLLRRMTMMANAISHTVLLGIVGALFLVGLQVHELSLSMPLFVIGSLIAALLTVVLIALFQKVFRLQEDASVGLVFTALFALSILLVTGLSHSVHIGTEVVMGSGDLFVMEDVSLAWTAGVINLGLVVLFFKEYRLSSFDELFARTSGGIPRFLYVLLMVQSALTTVASMRAVGVVVVLAFLVAPALIAKRYAKTMRGYLLLGVTISFGAVFLAVACSRHLLSQYALALSTGGIAATLLALFYIVSLKRSFQVSSSAYE